MTQRERIREEQAETTARPVMVGAAAATDENMALVNTTDQVRWGPIIAGLFAALATLATLSVLGLAVGLSALDTSQPASGFGLGAGIWGAITTLIAFAIGGWIAARTAAVAGSGGGILHGAMVWFVAIPLLLYALGSGLSAIARTVGGVASTALVAGSQAVGDVADNPALQATAQAGAQDLGQAAQATAQALGDQITPAQTQQAANAARDAAWATLLSLGLAAGAAIGGGYLGARPLRHTVRV